MTALDSLAMQHSTYCPQSSIRYKGCGECHQANASWNVLTGNTIHQREDGASTVRYKLGEKPMDRLMRSQSSRKDTSSGCGRDRLKAVKT